MRRVLPWRAARRRRSPHRLFDGCQAALVWLAALALVAPEQFICDLALEAMAAVALAATVAALFPAVVGMPPETLALAPSPPAKEPDDVVRPH